MTVFRFRVFFDIEDLDYQTRFVAANDSDEAREKLEAHFEKLHETGILKPVCIGDPIVELENVII